MLNFKEAKPAKSNLICLCSATDAKKPARNELSNSATEHLVSAKAWACKPSAETDVAERNILSMSCRKLGSAGEAQERCAVPLKVLFRNVAWQGA